MAQMSRLGNSLSLWLKIKKRATVSGVERQPETVTRWTLNRV
jgi:hypothetical protein